MQMRPIFVTASVALFLGSALTLKASTSSKLRALNKSGIQSKLRLRTNVEDNYYPYQNDVRYDNDHYNDGYDSGYVHRYSNDYDNGYIYGSSGYDNYGYDGSQGYDIYQSGYDSYDESRGYGYQNNYYSRIYSNDYDNGYNYYSSLYNNDYDNGYNYYSSIYSNDYDNGYSYQNNDYDNGYGYLNNYYSSIYNNDYDNGYSYQNNYYDDGYGYQRNYYSNYYSNYNDHGYGNQDYGYGYENQNYGYGSYYQDDAYNGYGYGNHNYGYESYSDNGYGYESHCDSEHGYGYGHSNDDQEVPSFYSDPAYSQCIMKQVYYNMTEDDNNTVNSLFNEAVEIAQAILPEYLDEIEDARRIFYFNARYICTYRQLYYYVDQLNNSLNEYRDEYYEYLATKQEQEEKWEPSEYDLERVENLIDLYLSYDKKANEDEIYEEINAKLEKVTSQEEFELEFSEQQRIVYEKIAEIVKKNSKNSKNKKSKNRAENKSIASAFNIGDLLHASANLARIGQHAQKTRE
ncbi:UNKNOWN [Stylonychia lemnae]|uniref:Uncharacterized protein n=1 Tax=Stylonychia lemnae TaxID=5949 RepID=A0A078AFR8_STYLE|nr:UNKNOWN [Stylonychia lemnae]|eukprot:CDW81079.1 UNKNOWN [Stylonychia lemnae]